jgi:hemerythrin
MHFEWTDDLNTGIPEIDLQNRRLGEYINTLDHAKLTANREQVAQVLEQLLDYAVSHFLFEEQLMESAGYEFRKSHERIHEIFAKRLAEFRGRFAKGEEVTDELLAMLKNWVEIHIKQEDRSYASPVQQAIAGEGGQTLVAGIMRKLFG